MGYKFTQVELDAVKANAKEIYRRLTSASAVTVDSKVKAVQDWCSKYCANNFVYAQQMSELASAIFGQSIEVASVVNWLYPAGTVLKIIKGYHATTGSGHRYKKDSMIMTKADNNRSNFLSASQPNNYNMNTDEVRLATPEEIDVFFRDFEPPRDENTPDVSSILNKL